MQRRAGACPGRGPAPAAPPTRRLGGPGCAGDGGLSDAARPSCRAQMPSPDRREPRPGSTRGARAVAADAHGGASAKPPRRIRPLAGSRAQTGRAPAAPAQALRADRAAGGSVVDFVARADRDKGDALGERLVQDLLGAPPALGVRLWRRPRRVHSGIAARLLFKRAAPVRGTGAGGMRPIHGFGRGRGATHGQGAAGQPAGQGAAGSA